MELNKILAKYPKRFLVAIAIGEVLGR